MYLLKVYSTKSRIKASSNEADDEDFEVSISTVHVFEHIERVGITE